MFLSLAFVCGLAPLGAASPAYDRAMQLLEEEDDTSKNLEAALLAFDEAVAAGGTPRELALAHANKGMAYLRLGELEKQEARQTEWFARGMEAAKTAVKVDDSCAQAWFLKGATLGRWAQQKGFVKALSHLGDIRTAFKNALQREPTNPDAQLAMGIMEYQVPRLMGGDKDSAEKRFLGVLKRDPHLTGAMLDYAEFLVDDSRNAEALGWIKKVRDEKAPSHPAAWRKFDRARALELLHKLKAD